VIESIGFMNTDSGIGQDTDETLIADRDASSAKQLTTNVRGFRGEQIIKALTKVEEKKTKRIARQEQVLIPLIYLIK